ncbi:uncharacterized protein An05g01090 [Aspergillus niger]|uniref:Contig An05c0040, genomic contig n=2 Tax=Aspergillus niger TaxID=5061 RepID=A2QKR2_ASPNC|nr:uncharacterized protein An05g01090 [Aspergillus niger]CAK39145.1 unnamed protein product [Aspergillus niger]
MAIFKTSQDGRRHGTPPSHPGKAGLWLGASVWTKQTGIFVSNAISQFETGIRQRGCGIRGSYWVSCCILDGFASAGKESLYTQLDGWASLGATMFDGQLEWLVLQLGMMP